MNTATLKSTIAEDSSCTSNVDKVSSSRIAPLYERNSAKTALRAVQVSTDNKVEPLQGVRSLGQDPTKTSLSRKIGSFLTKLFKSISIPGQRDIDKIYCHIRTEAVEGIQENTVCPTRKSEDQLTDPEQKRLERLIDQDCFIDK